MIKRLPDSCISMYANLLQKAEDSTWALLSGGSFVSKKINGATYWYAQEKLHGGRARQKYLGKESKELLDSIGRVKKLRDDAASILADRRRLVAMMAAGGASIEKGRPAKLLAKMADAGLFSSGGVLVGSFAYSCYGNMLGVSLSEDLAKTEDMDFSVEKRLEIGIVRSMLDEVKEVDRTFSTPRQINPSLPPFEVVASDGFKVEFLTTKDNALDGSPVLIDRFNLYAQPMEFMDYLIEGAQSAVVCADAGIPIRIPSPGRFALHKLAVSQLRPISFQSKIKKDLAQAASIIEVLVEDNPGDLIMAADALGARGDLFANHVRSGAGKLPAEIRNQLNSVVALPAAEWDYQSGVAVPSVDDVCESCGAVPCACPRG